MDYQHILLSEKNGIFSITLNRAEKRNAMNGEMVSELLQALYDIKKNPHLRLLMINGAGEHFCAGADIAWMQQMASSSFEDNAEDAQLLADLMLMLYSFPTPTMVLAHGATLGGGLGLLSACDIAIAANNATFGFSEVKIGIVPSVISPYVIRAIGERFVKYYFLTGERFNADMALKIGLLHQVTEPGALSATGMLIAESILENGPQAVRAAKELIQLVSTEEISTDLSEKTAEILANLRVSAEAEEGLRAFLEKRKPVWSTS